MKRYPFLDSLRGLAICGVVLTHVGLSTPGLPPALEAFATFGFRGVQLFFMVSALTLCLVSSPNHFNAKNFYVRRFFRIAPMFYLAAIFYLLFYDIGWMQSGSISVGYLDIIATFLFIHGFIPHSINNVVPGGWSIASEAIFYAIFPFLINFIRKPWQAFLFTCVAFIVAAGNQVIGRLIADLNNSDEAIKLFFHFDFFTNLPAFAMGFLLFHLLRRQPEPQPLTGFYGAAPVLMLIGFFAFCSVSRLIPNAQLAVVPLLGLVVYTAARWHPPIVVNAALSFLGEISFSIYLVHFAVLRLLVGFMSGYSPLLHLVVLFAAVLAGSSLLALVTYHAIERPMIAVGRFLTKSTFATAQVPMRS